MVKLAAFSPCAEAFHHHHRQRQRRLQLAPALARPLGARTMLRDAAPSDHLRQCGSPPRRQPAATRDKLPRGQREPRSAAEKELDCASDRKVRARSGRNLIPILHVYSQDLGVRSEQVSDDICRNRHQCFKVQTGCNRTKTGCKISV